MHVKLLNGESLKVYESDLGLFPSVTQILEIVNEPWRERWVARVGWEEAEKVRRDSLDLGSKVHKVAEQVASFGCTPKVCGCDGCPEELFPYHQAVARFIQTRVSKILGIEMTLLSPELRVGGTLDLYCRLHDGSLAIIDYKTSRSITPKNGLQLAGYSLMLHLRGEKPTRRLAVNLRKDSPGEYAVHSFDNDSQDADAFLALRRYWYWQYGPRLEEKLNAIGEERRDIAS